MSLLFTRSQVLRTVGRNLIGFALDTCLGSDSLCFKRFRASSSRKFGREQTFFSPLDPTFGNNSIGNACYTQATVGIRLEFSKTN